MPVRDRVVPFEEIKEGGGLLGTGAYHVKIGKFDEQVTKTGKAMLLMPYVVEAPGEYAGVERVEYIVIGTDADPACDSPETFKDAKNFGAKELKRIAKAAKIAASDNLLKIVNALEGKTVGAFNQLKRAVRDDGSPGWDMNITRWAEKDKVEPKAEPIPDFDTPSGGNAGAPAGASATSAIPVAVCPKCGDEYPMQAIGDIPMYGAHVRVCDGRPRLEGKTLAELMKAKGLA